MPKPLATLALVAAMFAMFAVPHAPAHAQTTPLADPSADELRAALFGTSPGSGLQSKAFARTAPPTQDGVCPGAGAVATESVSGGRTRNLEPVAYGGSQAPAVQLDIRFANASDALTPQSQAVLKRLAGVLTEPAALSKRFAVAGHTDSSGSEAINLELACARAIAARRFLVKQGVAPERLSAYGFGSSRPLPGTPADSPTNRRVEVRSAE
jgi:outer membrane protein OmpA-like peptidoglycan-associated protein